MPARFALGGSMLLAAGIWYAGTSYFLGHCGTEDGAGVPSLGAGSLDALGSGGDGGAAALPPSSASTTAAGAGRGRRTVALPPIDVPPALARHPLVRKRAQRLADLLEKARAGGGGGMTAAVETAALALAQAVLTAGGKDKGGAGGDAAREDAAGSAGAAAAAGEPDLLPEFTQQACYLQSDEQEHCVYTGTLCFDGHSPVVLVDKPIRSPERILDYTHSCSDFRYYEASALEISGCGYGYSSFRPYNASLPVRPGTDFPLPLTRRRWGAMNRNGHLYFKEVTPEEVYGPAAPPAARAAAGLPARSPQLARYARLLREAAYGGNPGVNVTWEEAAAGGGAMHWSPGGAYAAPVVAEGPFPHERVNGLTVARRTRVGNRTIDWIDGHLWLAGIDGQWWQNPYHWWTKMGALFDAQRANASAGHPDDGYVHASYGPGVEGGDISTPGGAAIRRGAGQGTWNRASWVVGPQWPMPPMDYVAFTGDGSINQATWVALLSNVSSLNPWFRATATLATQRGSKLLFADLLQSLDDYHYVCTTRGGAVPGTKHKLFTSRSDAWLMRQYAYDVVGRVPPSPSASPSRLPKNTAPSKKPDPAVEAADMRAVADARRATTAVSHPRHPPRKVTIIGRKGQNGRGIYNIDLVIDALKATGIPYEMVATMASLSFEAQVELMAGTGLLIAPHGAHLQQLMFLPAHAAVIELWPYLMKKSTYRYLATTLDLHYFPVYSWDLLPMTQPNIKQFYGVELMNGTYYYNKCVLTNISSYEALTEHACNAMSKNYPIVVPFPAFHHVLRDALDAIGAFSLTNDAWLRAAKVGPEELAEGVHPVPPQPEAPDGDLTTQHDHIAWQSVAREVP